MLRSARRAAIGADYADPFAACRELVATMFELDTPTPDLRAGYAMTFALFDYGPIKLGTSLAATPSVLVRSPETIARTCLDQIHVQFYRAGGFVMTIDGAARAVRAGDVALLDLSRPVTLTTDGIDNLSAIVARDLLAPLLDEEDDVHGLVLSRDGEAAIAVRELLEAMWSQAADLTIAQGLEASRAAAALLAGLIRAHRQRRAATRAELRTSQLRAIFRRIDRQIDDPGLCPASLARDFYLARPTLYRIFEPHGGIGRYILSRRLTGTFRDLSDPAQRHKPIAAILRRWGFTSHTAAGRAFRAAYGVTPSQCRARAREMQRAGYDPRRRAFDIPREVPESVRRFMRRQKD